MFTAQMMIDLFSQYFGHFFALCQGLPKNTFYFTAALCRGLPKNTEHEIRNWRTARLTCRSPGDAVPWQRWAGALSWTPFVCSEPWSHPSLYPAPSLAHGGTAGNSQTHW